MTPEYISVNVPGRWFSRGKDGQVWRRDPDRQRWVPDRDDRFRRDVRTAVPRGAADL
jgi:hypothetical protein